MELALYDETHGYYSTGGNRGGMKTSISPIGLEGGDFYTTPCLSPFLARAFVRQLMEVDELLGHPPTFTLLEMGPGEGRFMKDVIEEIEKTDGSFFSRLRVILVERSAFLRSIQEAVLGSCADKISWRTDLNELQDGTVVGVVVSNELVDAFPVHRVQREKDGLKEIYVDFVDDQFVEQLGEPSNERIFNFLKELDVDLPVGFTTEINLHAVEWMQHVARILRQGVVFTIDYGHTSQDYVSPVRKDGTLLCYYRHTVSTNPYERVGEQDMTAHVNFTSLAQVGEKAGLSLTGFTNLMHFLMSLGIDDMVADLEQESEAMKSAIELLRPQGMGTTFKVLVQHKGFDASRLQALRHRPFFEHVLNPVECGT